MLIDFNNAEQITMPCMNGGTGDMTAKMYFGGDERIILCRIHAGGSIGPHTQESGDDINYVLSGSGRAIFDGVEEPLSAGVCHICKKGSEDLVLSAIVAAR